jgi:hypothetical protein
LGHHNAVGDFPSVTHPVVCITGHFPDVLDFLTALLILF